MKPGPCDLARRNGRSRSVRASPASFSAMNSWMPFPFIAFKWSPARRRKSTWTIGMERFEECLKPLSNPELERLSPTAEPHLPDGYRTEVNLQALEWMEQVAQRIDRGFVLTIDYGHTAQDLYGPDRKDGTFLCYYQQLTGEDALRARRRTGHDRPCGLHQLCATVGAAPA